MIQKVVLAAESRGRDGAEADQGVVQAGELLLESNVFGISLLGRQVYGTDVAVEAFGYARS